MTIIESLKLSWLTDEEIKKISFGEIKNSKTLNASTFLPEEGGPFCQKIFGPSKSYRCACQSDQSQRIKNQKCEICGVLIASSNIRRWRPAHISLACPITNTPVLKSILPYLEQLLRVPGKAIKDLVYFNSYIVLDKGKSTVLQNKQILAHKMDPELIGQVLDEIIQSGEDKISPSVLKKAQELRTNLVVQKKKQIQTELNKVKKSLKLEEKNEKEKDKLQKKEEELQKELRKAKLEVVFLEDYLDFLRKNWKVKIETGSFALAELLKQIDLKAELKKISELPSEGNLEQTNNKRRFIQALLKNKLPLAGLVWNYLLVIPAGLRPATKLDSNNIATTQINNLDRKIILANERLKNILEINKSLQIQVLFSDIINNEKRRLQKAIDQRQSGEGLPKQSSAKSLLQILSGKEGILRKYSLGKRVDYSARSVISPNPSLTLRQVGLPVEMALILYKPFLFSALLKEGKSLDEVKQILLQSDSTIFPLLNEIIQNRPVLLNRAPTLHRLGMQGFQPILTLGKTIQLHPLVTVAFNADFDGDQMAVLLPLTKQSQTEIQARAMADSQILDPKNGSLIVAPTQDIVLGIYYLTRNRISSPTDKVRLYYETSQIEKDYARERIDFATPFIIPLPLAKRQFSGQNEQKFLYTTFGKWKFNQILPSSFPYYLNDLAYYNKHQNSPAPEDIIELPLSAGPRENVSGWKKKDIIVFLGKLTKVVSQAEMVKFLDRLKDLGFEAVTRSGISISLFDLPKIAEKEEMLQQNWTKLSQIEEYYDQGFYGKEEFIKQKSNLWAECKESLEGKIVQKLSQKTNSSLYYLWDSGARASSENLTQVFGMRGNMVDYKGNTIETPILSSLKEGLNPFEFFISVYGAMKGMMDTALKTAEAGYLTRQLVETVQNIIIVAEDCQTEKGIQLSELKEKTIFGDSGNVLMSLEERIAGRYLAQDLIIDNQKILTSGTLLSSKEISLLKENKISAIRVRSPFTCSLVRGICQKCYGLDLSKNGEIIELGTAVGIIAAQSLGEPGTQLTMNTFHTGGVAGEEDIVQGLPKVKEILGNILPPKQKQAVLAQITGKINEIIEDEKNQQVTIKQKSESGQELNYTFDLEKKIKVKVGQVVQKGENLTVGKVSLEKLLEITGREICQNYIKEEIWKIYYAQGIRINEKHIELFTRQMLNNVEITRLGDSNYLIGDIVNYQEFCQTNQDLKNKKKELAQAKNLVFGLKQIVKYSPSFLASISFQETLKTLINYSIFQPVDYLQGVKENLVAGQLAPIGPGLKERQKLVNKKKVKN